MRPTNEPKRILVAARSSTSVELPDSLEADELNARRQTP